MATRQEIIDVLDALLENRITPREAYLWAKKEIPKTDHCEDPPSALLTMLDELNPDPVVVPSGNWREELLLDREVLIRGIPCPEKEHGKSVQAFFMAYTPGEKVVLCQIKKTEAGDRVLELIEEAWEGEQTFYQQVPIPYKGENGQPLSKAEVNEQKKTYKAGALEREEAIRWVVTQLQKKAAESRYVMLLEFYWKLSRPDDLFSPERFSEGYPRKRGKQKKLNRLRSMIQSLFG